MRKGDKYLSLGERRLIEKLYNEKDKSPREIAELLDRCASTIYNELKRGMYTHRLSDWREVPRYSADLAQAAKEAAAVNKGCDLKIGNDIKLANFIEEMIGQKGYSPEATLLYIKENNLKFKVEIKSNKTIYSYIDKGIFLSITNQSLPCKGKNQNKKKKIIRKQKKLSAGTSIEKRPDEINSRETFGHWEMDTVQGKKTAGKTMLVLTERKTRFEIIEPLKSKTSAEVIKAINRIEKEYGRDFYNVFKSITVDNGSEFNDVKSLEKSLYRVGKRTDFYYCHAYCASERGSNENQNKLIRRFIKKGTSFSHCKKPLFKVIEIWMNKYPRKIFDGKNSETLYMSELEKINANKILNHLRTNLPKEIPKFFIA